MKRSNAIGAVSAAVISLVLAGTVAHANPSNKWRLQFSGKAHSDGTIVLKFSPVGSEPITVDIPIPDGTSENHVAEIVAKSLQDRLPSDAFHIERDDGEDVLIKKRRHAASFDVELVSNTVEHVRIRPDRE